MVAQPGFEVPDHAEVDEADLGSGQDHQVARVEVGVEEAVLVEHADDCRGADVDQTPTLLGGQGRGDVGVRAHTRRGTPAQHLVAADSDW